MQIISSVVTAVRYSEKKKIIPRSIYSNKVVFLKHVFNYHQRFGFSRPISSRQPFRTALLARNAYAANINIAMRFDEITNFSLTSVVKKKKKKLTTSVHLLE